MPCRPAAAVALATVLATALAGCGAITQPMGRYAVTEAAASRSVTVIRGDTVYELARRYNVAVRALIDANGLRPPYHLYPGQTVYLPNMAVHTVVAGDTVSQVARTYNVAMADLVRANGLSEPYVIRVGERLRLPRMTAEEQARSETFARPAPPLPPVKPEPPAVVQPAPQAPAVAAAPVPAVAVRVPEPPPFGGSFVWPAKGDLIARFGPQGKGMHNDGINIAVQHGAPVHAAADGVVAYAGNELRGFGRLLLVKHGGGWMSAYAHNEELLVGRGARVKRGQVIARAGSTGNVRGPQLHFELRKGATPVDPLAHLPSLKAGLCLTRSGCPGGPPGPG